MLKAYPGECVFLGEGGGIYTNSDILYMLY